MRVVGHLEGHELVGRADDQRGDIAVSRVTVNAWAGAEQVAHLVMDLVGATVVVPCLAYDSRRFGGHVPELHTKGANVAVAEHVDQLDFRSVGSRTGELEACEVRCAAITTNLSQKDLRKSSCGGD